MVSVGNDLVGDDAVGGLIRDHLSRAALPEGARLVRLGPGGCRVLDALDGEDLLLLCDAACSGAAPRAVHILAEHELPAPDAHAHGLVELLALARAVCPEDVPRRVVVVGVEGVRFDPVGVPTDAVLAAVERAVAAVLEAPRCGRMWKAAAPVA